MKKVDILNLDIKLWAQKSELPQGNFLRFLTQTEITRQKPFEFTYIEYDQIKDEITWIECDDYNTSVGINVMNVDDI